MSVMSLQIEGMSCGHCVNSVRKALDSLPGVEIRSVTIGGAEVDVAEGGPNLETIAGAVTEAGYRATPVLAE